MWNSSSCKSAITTMTYKAEQYPETQQENTTYTSESHHISSRGFLIYFFMALICLCCLYHPLTVAASKGVPILLLYASQTPTYWSSVMLPTPPPTLPAWAFIVPEIWEVDMGARWDLELPPIMLAIWAIIGFTPLDMPPAKSSGSSFSLRTRFKACKEIDGIWKLPLLNTSQAYERSHLNVGFHKNDTFKGLMHCSFPFSTLTQLALRPIQHHKEVRSGQLKTYSEQTSKLLR